MDTIPEDVWPLIASFMDDKTKRWLRLANTKWFNIIKYDDFKLYFTRTENIGAITDRLSKYSWPIKVSFIKSKIDNALDLINNLPKLTNVIEISSDGFLSFDYQDITHEQWMQLSTLTNLQLWSIESTKGKMPKDLWEKFTKLTDAYLLLNRFDEEEVKQICKNMTDLQSFGYSPDIIYFGRPNPWHFTLLPNPDRLTKFCAFNDSIQTGEEMLPRLTYLKHLLLRDDAENTIELSYLTALDHFECYFFGNKLPSFGANTNLTSLTIDCWSSNTTEDIRNLINLRQFTIDLAHQHKEPLDDLSVLADLHQLTSFCAHKSQFAAPNLKLVPKSSFQYLPPSLKTLKTDFEVDLADLTHLTNLEVLDLNQPLLNVENISILSNLTLLRLTQDWSDVEQSWKSVEKLTKLEDLTLTVGYKVNSLLIDDLPDISNLTNVTKLRWGLNGCKTKTLDQIKSMTGLKELNFIPNEKGSKTAIESAEFLQELTNLVKLEMIVDVTDGCTYQCISALTKLEYLDLYNILDDDHLLLLTGLYNLTYLSIRNPAHTVDGHHFTALTSLQIINFPVYKGQSRYGRELIKIMPYLIRFDFEM